MSEILLTSNIVDSWVWSDKPFSKGQALIDLYMRANNVTSKFIGGEIARIGEGEIVTSMKTLATAWGWDRKKVTAFMCLLESEGIIERFSDNRYSKIVIKKELEEIC